MIGGLMMPDMAALRTIRLLPVLALGLVASSPALADAIVCKPNYDYSVEVDGSYPKNATLYQAASPGMYYVDVPACKTGLLMDMKARKVVAVPREQIKQVDGGLQMNDTAPPTATAYALAVDGPFVQFQAEDKKVRILRCLDRPPIVGAVDRGLEQVHEESPDRRLLRDLVPPLQRVHAEVPAGRLGSQEPQHQGQSLRRAEGVHPGAGALAGPEHQLDPDHHREDRRAGDHPDGIPARRRPRDGARRHLRRGQVERFVLAPPLPDRTSSIALSRCSSIRRLSPR